MSVVVKRIQQVLGGVDDLVVVIEQLPELHTQTERVFIWHVFLHVFQKLSSLLSFFGFLFQDDVGLGFGRRFLFERLRAGDALIEVARSPLLTVGALKRRGVLLRFFVIAEFFYNAFRQTIAPRDFGVGSISKPGNIVSRYLASPFPPQSGFELGLSHVITHCQDRSAGLAQPLQGKLSVWVHSIANGSHRIFNALLVWRSTLIESRPDCRLRRETFFSFVGRVILLQPLMKIWCRHGRQHVPFWVVLSADGNLIETFFRRDLLPSEVPDFLWPRASIPRQRDEGFISLVPTALFYHLQNTRVPPPDFRRLWRDILFRLRARVAAGDNSGGLWELLTARTVISNRFSEHPDGGSEVRFSLHRVGVSVFFLKVLYPFKDFLCSFRFLENAIQGLAVEIVMVFRRRVTMLRDNAHDPQVILSLALTGLVVPPKALVELIDELIVFRSQPTFISGLLNSRFLTLNTVVPVITHVREGDGGTFSLPECIIKSACKVPPPLSHVLRPREGRSFIYVRLGEVSKLHDSVANLCPGDPLFKLHRLQSPTHGSNPCCGKGSKDSLKTPQGGPA